MWLSPVRQPSPADCEATRGDSRDRMATVRPGYRVKDAPGPRVGLHELLDRGPVRDGRVNAGFGRYRRENAISGSKSSLVSAD